MLNEKQKEIADYLLKYLEQKGGKSSLDDYPSVMQNQGFDDFEWNFLKDFLRDQLGLVYYSGNTDYILALTREGFRAAEVGIGRYFELIEEEKELEKINLISSIEGVKSSKKLSKIAITVAIIVPLLSIGINLWVQKVSDQKDVKNESNIRITKSDSTNMEKIKFHLKNDPQFLNDLKDLIKKK